MAVSSEHPACHNKAESWRARALCRDSTSGAASLSFLFFIKYILSNPVPFPPFSPLIYPHSFLSSLHVFCSSTHQVQLVCLHVYGERTICWNVGGLLEPRSLKKTDSPSQQPSVAHSSSSRNGTAWAPPHPCWDLADSLLCRSCMCSYSYCELCARTLSRPANTVCVDLK